MKKMWLTLLVFVSTQSHADLSLMMKIYNNPASAPKVANCKKDVNCDAFVALSKQWLSIEKSYKYNGFDIKNMAKKGDGYGLNKGFSLSTDRSIELRDAAEMVFFDGQMGKKGEDIFAKGLAVLLYIEDKNGWVTD